MHIQIFSGSYKESDVADIYVNEGITPHFVKLQSKCRLEWGFQNTATHGDQED